VSAYARSDRTCRHNVNYWRFGDYLGIGAGAHGKCTRPRAATDEAAAAAATGTAAALHIERTSKWREPRRYLRVCQEASAHHSLTQCREVPAADLPFEYLMNALRLTAGFEPSEYEARTGLDFQTVEPRLAVLAGRGLLRRRERHWCATARGLELLNEVLADFLPTTAQEL